MTDSSGEPASALVRPYIITAGRTKPRVDIAIDALVQTTARGRAQRDAFLLRLEQHHIATLCIGHTFALAEISARMRLPLGVARVLVADMAADGTVAVYEPAPLDKSDPAATELLARVLSRLKRL